VGRQSLFHNASLRWLVLLQVTNEHIPGFEIDAFLNTNSYTELHKDIIGHYDDAGSVVSSDIASTEDDAFSDVLLYNSDVDEEPDEHLFPDIELVVGDGAYGANIFTTAYCHIDAENVDEHSVSSVHSSSLQSQLGEGLECVYNPSPLSSEDTVCQTTTGYKGLYFYSHTIHSDEQFDTL
jgi:hypothetical protein